MYPIQYIVSQYVPRKRHYGNTWRTSGHVYRNRLAITRRDLDKNCDTYRKRSHNVNIAHTHTFVDLPAVLPDMKHCIVRVQWSRWPNGALTELLRRSRILSYLRNDSDVYIVCLYGILLFDAEPCGDFACEISIWRIVRDLEFRGFYVIFVESVKDFRIRISHCVLNPYSVIIFEYKTILYTCMIEIMKNYITF